jgi:hypothetical protein
MSDEILDRLAHGEDSDSEDVARKRRQLNERRKRLRDLYELGDVDRSEYVSKRDALDAELDALDPEPRRALLQQLFELVWVDGQKIVAVRPTPAFADLFTGAAATSQRGVKGGSDGGQTRVLHPSGIEIRIG